MQYTKLIEKKILNDQMSVKLQTSFRYHVQSTGAI